MYSKNHTICDTFIIKIDNNKKCSDIIDIINTKYGVDVEALYIGDKQISKNTCFKEN